MSAPAPVKPCCEACERNKAPIAAALQEHFCQSGDVLEIASGTGQHAVHFAKRMPHLVWHCSELSEKHAGILAWLEGARLENVVEPIVLDVAISGHWPGRKFRYAYTANTTHILAWQQVVCMFRGVSGILPARGLFAVYGPFNRGGDFTSAGNRCFDAALRAENPEMGLRDLEQIEELGAANGMLLRQTIEMPANNLLLMFEQS